MRFTLGRMVHFYYVAVLCAITGLFFYGVKYYWDTGLLNTEYVSNLYDGTSRVGAIKERNDLDEIKKFVDGDRIKEADHVFTRLEKDIQDLKSIHSTDGKTTFEDNIKKIKIDLLNLKSSPELSTIINNISTKVTVFESFVTEKKWPTLMKMAINLRIKTSPGRLMQGGLFNFEKTQNLSLSINNDIEAMTNFVHSTGLAADIKVAIVNRLQNVKSSVVALESYVEEHKKFNRVYKDFSADYEAWFKLVGPEIALKKIQFEKSSQTIFYSLIAIFSSFAIFLTIGFVIYNYSAKRGSQKIEKLILDTIKESLLPVGSKKIEKFSSSFATDLEKYRDYVHKRMSFGSIFQEAMPFASILLDSNLNLVWGNSHFYEQWQLQNFNDDGGDSLTWDFLQRFTNLEDNSAILSALRMSISGIYRIQIKNTSKAFALPYEMHVSPVDYAGQKRIMIIFYPMSEMEVRMDGQKATIISPILNAVDAYLNDTMTVELKHSLRNESDKAGISELYAKFSQYVEKNESIKDELYGEIERIENELHGQQNIIGDMRKSLVVSFENQRGVVEKYNHFKSSVSSILDARDQIEELFKYTLNSSREFYKDQNKILSNSEKADKTVDDYMKSLKTITVLKSEFKDLKGNIEEFKLRITQALDQLLIFQNHDDDTRRMDQFLGKIKFEMKGLEKVLNDFGQVVTQLDVTVMKLDIMVESREKIDLEPIRLRLEAVKNNLENAQFSSAKISQSSRSKDDELILILKELVASLKIEMKQTDEMCRLTGLTSEHLKLISPTDLGA